VHEVAAKRLLFVSASRFPLARCTVTSRLLTQFNAVTLWGARRPFPEKRRCQMSLGNRSVYPPALRQGVHSYETRYRKGRRKSRSDGWAAAGRGFPANCPSEALGCTLTDYISRPWSGRLAHSDKTAHYTVLVIHADRTRPVSPATPAMRTATGSRCYFGGANCRTATRHSANNRR